MCKSGNETRRKADDIIRTVADNLVLTMECYSIESCMRGYQAGASYLCLLHRSQQEVQASFFRRLPAALLLYLLHQSQHEGWLAIEDHEDRGHCQLDIGNE